MFIVNKIERVLYFLKGIPLHHNALFIPQPRLLIFSISATVKLFCKPWLPICLAFKFKANRWTKQVTCNNFSNEPNFEQSVTSPIHRPIFSSTTFTVTTSFCFSESSIAVKLYWFGISNCSVIRKFSPSHHNKLFTSLIGLVIHVAMFAGFIFVRN